MSKFHVRINGGPEQVLKTKTSLYGLAAVAACALFDYLELPEDDKVIYAGAVGGPAQREECVLVKIWVPELVKPDSSGHCYGPYYYGVTDNGTACTINPETLPHHLR